MGYIIETDTEHTPLAIPAPWIIEDKVRRERRPVGEEARIELPRAHDDVREREDEDSPQHDGVIVIDI